jgi:hypothetical protein
MLGFCCLLALDYLQQVALAHLQKASICSTREQDPVLHPQQCSPFPLRNDESVVLPQALGSSMLWPEAEERGEDGEEADSPDLGPEREIAADRICVAAGRIEPRGGESRRGVNIDAGARDAPQQAGSAADAELPAGAAEASRGANRRRWRRASGRRRRAGCGLDPLLPREEEGVAPRQR